MTEGTKDRTLTPAEINDKIAVYARCVLGENGFQTVKITREDAGTSGRIVIDFEHPFVRARPVHQAARTEGKIV